jgi:hypothetical protein
MSQVRMQALKGLARRATPAHDGMLCACADTFSMRDDPLASISFPVACPILIADAASGRVARFLIPEAGQMERFKAEVRTIA